MWSQEENALHSVLVEEQWKVDSDYVSFMMRLFVLRRYRLELWQRLVPALPPSGPPHWKEISRTFAALSKTEGPWFPSQFRPCTLRSYYSEGGIQRSAEGMTRQAREVQTLKLLWSALPRREIAAFTVAACPHTFGAMYDKLREGLDEVGGVFGDYGVKLMLDLLVLLGGVPPGAISRWPVAGCPGYRITLAALFPELPQEEHLRALYWVHRQLGRARRFQFPESAAQLCWDHRRLSGHLDDDFYLDA